MRRTAFLRRNFQVIAGIVVIFAWLAAFPSLLRMASLEEVNQTVTLATGSEPVSIVAIDRSGDYECALILQPAGSVAHEIASAWRTRIMRTEAGPPTELNLNYECMVYPLSAPQRAQSATKTGWAYGSLDHPINLTRVHTIRLSTFRLSPGLHVVKARILGVVADPGRPDWSVRADLVPESPGGTSWMGGPWRAWLLLPVVNWLLFWFGAFLCAVLVLELVGAALRPVMRRGRERMLARSPGLTRFADWPGGRKKVVLALPVVLVSIALFYAPLNNIGYAITGLAFLVSTALLLVGLVEMRWARGIARTDAAMARLPSIVRDLIALAAVAATVGIAVLVAKLIT